MALIFNYLVLCDGHLLGSMAGEKFECIQVIPQMRLSREIDRDLADSCLSDRMHQQAVPCKNKTLVKWTNSEN
jgi:hypothetical protein